MEKNWNNIAQNIAIKQLYSLLDDEVFNLSYNTKWTDWNIFQHNLESGCKAQEWACNILDGIDKDFLNKSFEDSIMKDEYKMRVKYGEHGKTYLSNM